MPEFQKLRLKQFPQIQDRETSEAKYWKAYSITKEEKLLGTPNCIHFNPVSSDSYVVTASTKVMLYDSLSDKVQRSYSRFTDDCFSGRFRKDGKLLVAGDKEGYVKVFDVKTKALLRQLKRHTAAVRATTWARWSLTLPNLCNEPYADTNLTLPSSSVLDNQWRSAYDLRRWRSQSQTLGLGDARSGMG